MTETTSPDAIVVTLEANRSRAGTTFGMGVFFVLASVGLGIPFLPSFSGGDVGASSYLVGAIYVVFVGALATMVLSEGFTQLRPTFVVVDPKAFVLRIPTFDSTWSSRPSGFVELPLGDYFRAQARELGLKGVRRGKVQINGHVAESSWVPGYEHAPYEDLERFAAELDAAVASARAKAPQNANV